jgi:hypothetical protein
MASFILKKPANCRKYWLFKLHHSGIMTNENIDFEWGKMDQDAREPYRREAAMIKLRGFFPCTVSKQPESESHPFEIF